MTNQKRVSLFALITLVTLLVNLAFPIPVLADDETPPTVATEETARPEESEAETLSDSTEETTPPQDSETETSPQDSTGEPAPVSEVLEQLPEDTNLIVLDENGEALPLVTQAAEEAILTSDPMWCPDGVAPYDVGCSPPYTSMTELLTWLATNNPNQAGTIWIQDSYDSSTNAGDAGVVTGFTFDGSSLTNMADHALTIQGGWDGNSGSTTITGNSTFDGDFLHVISWVGNVTINNIFVSDTTAHGIRVSTHGDINLDNVTSENNAIDGAYLYNSSGTGAISVTDGQFNGNDDFGLEALSNGNITLNTVTANGNSASGAYLDNTSGSGNVSVQNSQFNNNGTASGNHGLWVESDGNVTLNNITANNNYYVGASLGNYDTDSFIGGNVFISNSTFNRNGLLSDWDGLNVFADGNVEITNVTANENGYAGFWIGASDDGTPNGGDVTITNSTTNNNSDSGMNIETLGTVSLNKVTSNDNDYDGVYIDNSYGAGQVFVTNSQFNNNYYAGLDVDSAGSITLNSVIANRNGGVGAYLYNCGCMGIVGITITGTNAFNSNGYAGLLFDSDGDVNIENVTANNNGVGGIGGDAGGNITIKNVIAQNSQYGLGFGTLGNVTVQCSIITNNSNRGVDVDASSLNLIGSTITNNGINYFNNSGPVNIFDYDCNPSSTPPSSLNKPKPDNSGSGLPLNTVFGNNADLNCDSYSGTVLILPNGDKVTFKCPIRGSATLNPLAVSDLPEDVEFVSGLVAVLSPDGSDVALNGLVVISFVIPEDMQGEDFAILYWDNDESAWLDLDEATFDDGRKVVNGGYITDDGYFEAFTNFSGNFVLVKK